MASKLERLKQRMSNMREQTMVVARNVLHSGETLIVGGAGAYAEGRMSDDSGEWGYKNVPYLYVGGAILYLTGLFAGPRYSADLFAAGTGAVGGHLFRHLYESGLQAKKPATAGQIGSRSVPMMGAPGLRERMQSQHQEAVPAHKHGTVFDGLR